MKVCMEKFGNIIYKLAKKYPELRNSLISAGVEFKEPYNCESCKYENEVCDQCRYEMKDSNPCEFCTAKGACCLCEYDED